MQTPIGCHAGKVGEAKRPTDDRLLLTHSHFDHVLGIPGVFSTLRLRQSSDPTTIHGGPGTLDVVVRMLAGLWGEGRAPISLELVCCQKERSSTPANSGSGASRSATATPTAPCPRSKCVRDGICCSNG